MIKWDKYSDINYILIFIVMFIVSFDDFLK